METYEQDVVYFKLIGLDTELLNIAETFRYEINDSTTRTKILIQIEQFLRSIPIVEYASVGYSLGDEFNLELNLDIHFKCYRSPTWHQRTINFKNHD